MIFHRLITHLDCWAVDQESGKRKPFPLPELSDDLKNEFRLLKAFKSDDQQEPAGPLKVRWVPPGLEGKAEIPEGLAVDAVKRLGLEAKVKIETPKPKKWKKQESKQEKKFLIIFGEWSDSDKQNLRDQNPDDPAKGVVEKAIKDFEKNWEAKAQSRKAEKPDSDEEENVGDDQ